MVLDQQYSNERLIYSRWVFTVLLAAASSETCYRYSVVNDSNTTLGQVAWQTFCLMLNEDDFAHDLKSI